MKIFANVITILLFLLGSVSCGICSKSQRSVFLKQPDRKSFEYIIENAKSKKCEDMVPSQSDLTRMYDLISSGSALAFEAALVIQKCLDGGELEDFYRSAGVFCEHNPTLYLQIIKNRNVNKSQIKYHVTMLPLEAVDDFEMQMQIINKRIVAIESVIDKESAENKSEALNALAAEKEYLKEIISKINNTSH